MLKPREYVQKVVRRVRGLPVKTDDRVLGDDGRVYRLCDVAEADRKFAELEAVRRSRAAPVKGEVK